MLRGVASALALMHARRDVHRDVNARNVWRTHDGQHKLIDFGTLAPLGKAQRCGRNTADASWLDAPGC